MTRDQEWQMNPLSKYVTQDQWKKIAQDTSPYHGQGLKIQTLVINTQSTQDCERARQTLLQMRNIQGGQDIENLCTQAYKDHPWVSITVVEPARRDQLEIPIDIRPDEGIGREVFNFGLMGTGMMGILLALPPSVTKWDDSKSKNDILQKWKTNVTSAPVLDKDEWAVNYVGHPVSGAAYYVVARHLNYSVLDSFKFSFLMSTFFWEYGFEAVIEKPSIQDLIITPVIGSLLGEIFYQSAKKIEANDGKVMGSKGLGTVSMFILNPAGSISKKINHVYDTKLVKQSSTSFVMATRDRDSMNPGMGKSTYAGFQLMFKF